MLKKVLAAFAFLMVAPLASQAITFTNSFLTSSTGTATIGVSETIQFEVSLTTVNGKTYQIGTWVLSGDWADADSIAGGQSPYPNVDNVVTGWTYNYKTGSGDVKMATNGLITPTVVNFPPPVKVSGQYGFGLPLTTPVTGNGNTNVVGTVTITADAAGTYLGGGYVGPFEGWGSVSTGADPDTNVGAAFTVIPEPGTAVLMLLGLGGLGVMGRKGRS